MSNENNNNINNNKLVASINTLNEKLTALTTKVNVHTAQLNT